LNRASINALVGTAELQTRIVRDVGLSSPVTTAVGALKNACGTKWTFDQADPQYDCSLTALGQTFRGPDGTALTSPEFALLRMLTMTPANANVDGTSLEQLKDLANSFGIGGGFNQLLADTYGIARTRELVPAAQFVTTLLARFVGSHPAASATDGLEISLYDALNDISTWGSKFGPISGGHPGILDPSTPPRAILLGTGFAVGVNGISNLQSFQGIDLSAAATGVLRRPQPPSGDPPDDAAAWDLTVAGASTTGIQATASAALRMRMRENTSFIRACEGTACKSNTRRSRSGPRSSGRRRPGRSRTCSRSPYGKPTSPVRCTYRTFSARSRSTWARTAIRPAGRATSRWAASGALRANSISGSRRPSSPR
jgi:hypothetical protein